jgi:hypothetical protein
MLFTNTTPRNTQNLETNTEFKVNDIKLIEDLSNHEPFLERFSQSTSHLTEDQKTHIFHQLKSVLSCINAQNTEYDQKRNPYPNNATWTERRFYENLFYKFLDIQAYINNNNLTINYEFNLFELVDLVSCKNKIAPKEGLHPLILISKKPLNVTYEATIQVFTFSDANNIGLTRQDQTTASFCDFIKSFIVNVLDVSVNFTSLFKIGDPEENIYSTLNNNFCNNFKLNEIPVLSNKFVFSTAHQLRSVFFKNARRSTVTNIFFNNPDLPSISLSDYFYNTTDTRTEEKPAVLKTFNALSPAIIEDLFPETNIFQAYHIPSWESKSAKNPEFKTVTKNFLSKRKGLFAPVLTKAVSLNDNYELENVYILSLLNFTNKAYSFISNLGSYKNMSKAFLEFIERYSFENGLFFKNPEEALEKYNSRFKTVLNYNLKDTNFMNSDLKNYLEYYLNNVNSLNYSYNSLKNVFSLQDTKAISYSYQKNPILVKKQNKLQLKFNKFKTKIKNQQEIYNNLASISYSIKSKLKQDYQTFLSFYKKLKNSQTIDVNLYNSYNKLTTFSQKLQKSIQEDKLNKINSNQLELDPFFLNLKQNNISLLFIKYLNEDNQNVILNKETFNEPNFVFSQDDVFAYEEVEFIIDQPTPIYVDSRTKPKAIKVGGPYIVRVTNSSIGVKLKDKNSFFGVQNNDSIIVHPHSGSVPVERMFKSYANACLGEASPLLFSAFKKKDLKLIILSALTWINSANSADTWGRRYKYFMDYDLFDFAKQDSPQEQNQEQENEKLTQTETENIITILNDTIEEEEDNQEQEDLTEMTSANRLSQEEFTSTPETYTSYSSRASLWTD